MLPADVIEYPTFRISSLHDLVISRPDPDIVVVDNFYRDPMQVREFALRLDYRIHTAIYDSQWTESLFIAYKPLIHAFEHLLGIGIAEWHNPPRTASNGSFQYVTEDVGVVIHADSSNRYGGVLYLTPGAPPGKGTGFFQHKETGLIRPPTREDVGRFGAETLERYRRRDQWRGGQTPRLEAWTLLQEVTNRFNRLVLFDATRYHSGLGGFGTTKEDGRLYQTFFFS
jgi:hypothetical protein